MASINRIPRSSKPKAVTHEGAPAVRPASTMHELRRAVVSCFLWEDQFYESGTSIATRIENLVAAQSDKGLVANLAREARTDFNLRHVPLLLIAAMVWANKSPTRDQVSAVIQRPDEMGELIALIWSKGKRPLPKQVKLGIADAMLKFSAYSLSKYNSNSAAIKLRDVLRLVHPKTNDAAKNATFRSIIDGTLASPDTWEVALSAGEDKKLTFERLLRENQLGYFALIRNLRNMEQAGVDRSLVSRALLARENGADRILPFRFISAYRAAPSYANELNTALLASMAEVHSFSGRTIILTDVSGSMQTQLSGKSDLTRLDAACALAAIFPGDNVRVFSFSGSTVEVPAFRGIPGIDAIRRSQPNGSTYLGAAVTHANSIGYDRLIVITDEQSHDRVPAPLPGTQAYMVNVAAYQNGVSYADWIKIDGFSESVLKFIREIEA